ncbi:MAG: CRTAC1 family protein [Planctomycetaceae bacterium]
MVDDNTQLHPRSPDDERDDSIITQALLWSLAVVVVLAVGVGGGIVLFRQSPAEGPAPVARTQGKACIRERLPLKVPEFRFTDVTQQAGIAFVHENGARGEKLFPETMGGGAAFFDYDNDGDPDLLFVGSKRWETDSQTDGQTSLTLYQNDGTGKFRDVTDGSGLSVSLYGMGVAVGDFDDDGFADVYVTSLGRNILYRNRGDGRFEDVTATAGVAGAKDGWSTSAGFFDMDNDGDLDLFVCNYVQWSRAFDVGQKFTLDGSTRAYGKPQSFPCALSYLFRNDGEGGFTDVSASAGIQVRNRREKPLGKSLGVCFADFNRDGYADIVVANDTVQNFLFENQRDGTFVEVAKKANIAYDTKGNPRGAMGIDVARFRNNDELGVAIGNFSNEMTALFVSRSGEALFTDSAIANGIGPVTRKELTFGLFFFDADLDGRPDLFASNGHLERDIAKVQSRQSYEQSPQLLWNCGPGYATEFLPVVAPAKPVPTDGETDADYRKRMRRHEDAVRNFNGRMGGFVRRMVGRGAAFADIDRDGDLDVVIVANGRPARLLRNDQQLGRNWLQVKAIGKSSNRDAVGAWVEVHLAGGKILRQQVMPTRSYLSQVELPVTFGLGESKRVEFIRVQWPGGGETRITTGLRIKTRIDVTQPARP